MSSLKSLGNSDAIWTDGRVLALIAATPKTWGVRRLKEVCTKITDGTHKTPNYQPEGVRFISIKNIRPFRPINWDAYEKFISHEEHEELTRRCKPEFDDVLFPRIGTLGFAKRIDFLEEVSIFVGLGLLKPNRELIRPKFLELWMNHPLIAQLSRDQANGSGRLTLPLEQTREFPVVVPSLVEQDEIVAEIEKQFSRLDEAVANLQRVKANLKRYKAAVLKAAVEGRLVEAEADLARREGRSYETGEQLLQRILEERRARWTGRGKCKEPVAADAEGLHGLPYGWTWCACDQISEKITDGEHISPKTIEQGIPLLSAKDVLDTGVTFEDAKYVAAADSEKFRSRCNPDRGDVLIVSRGATIGRACLVNSDREFCLMGSVILMKPDVSVNSAYLLHALKAEFFQTRLTAVSGSTAQQAIYIRDIRPLQLPLPPLAEQARIVAEIDRHLSIVREVEAEVDANLKRAQALRQATLAKAFAATI